MLTIADVTNSNNVEFSWWKKIYPKYVEESWND